MAGRIADLGSAAKSLARAGQSWLWAQGLRRAEQALTGQSGASPGAGAGEKLII